VYTVMCIFINPNFNPKFLTPNHREEMWRFESTSVEVYKKLTF